MESTTANDVEPKGRWGSMPRRLRFLITLAVAVAIALPVLAVPTIDRTRDAHYEVVSFSPELWVTRDGRYAAWMETSYREGFWCSYYDFANVRVVEKEGRSGGTYTVTFHYPSTPPTSTTFTLAANEEKTIQSEELCADNPGQNTITFTLAAAPPRINEKNQGIYSGNETWDLKANLTLRELEGTGGEYVIVFKAQPNAASMTVRGNLSAKGVMDFKGTLRVPDANCCFLEYQINAPKIQERVSMLGALSR